MARNDDGVGACCCEILLGGLDHAVDVASARIVDEGIEAVPEGVTTVKDVCFAEVDGEIGVGVGWLIVSECQSVVLIGEGSIAVEEDSGKSANRSGRNDGFVGNNVLSSAHAVAGVLVGPDRGAGRVDPVVAVGVVEVPVGIDEDLNGVAIDGGESRRQLGLAGGIAGVDEEFAFLGGENRNVAASPAEKGEVPSEGRERDLVVCVGGAGPCEEILGCRGRRLLSQKIAGIEAGDCSYGSPGGEELASGDRCGWLGHDDSSFAVEDIWNGHGIERVEELLRLKFHGRLPMMD